MPKRSLLRFVLGLLSIFALCARASLADDPKLVVTIDASNTLTAVLHGDGGESIHFDYQTDNCPAGMKTCIMFTAGMGAAGIPVTAASPCIAKGEQYSVSSVQCPADGITAVVISMPNGGTASAYQGGGGQHTGSTCFSSLTIKASGMGSVNTWNGCHETVICGSKTIVVEADSTDSIRGQCMSVVKH